MGTGQIAAQAVSGAAMGAAGGPAGMLIGALAPIAFGLAQSAIQNRKAKELAKIPPVNYDIPSGYKGSLNVAKDLYNNPVTPEMTRGLDKGIANATYNALEYGDPNKGIFTANYLAEKKNDTLAGVIAENRNFAATNYQNAQNQYGQQQQYQWERNVGGPRDIAYQREREMRMASQQNLGNAINAGSQAYFGYKTMDNNYKLGQQSNANTAAWLKSLNGGQGGGTSSTAPSSLPSIGGFPTDNLGGSNGTSLSLNPKYSYFNG